MVRVLEHPKVISILSTLGILFLLISSGMALSHAPTVSAADCNSAPPLNSPPGQATNWRLQNWLMFSDLGVRPQDRRSIPIGPSRWTVTSRLKQSGQEYCFVEDWSVQKVVFQSSRDGNRGTLINVNNASSYGIDFNGLSTTSPKNKLVKNNRAAWYCGGVPDNEWGQKNFPQCFTSTFSHIGYSAFDIVPPGVDPDRDPTTTNWSPLGQYGLLYTSSNNLTPARGYIPVEWLIVGN